MHESPQDPAAPSDDDLSDTRDGLLAAYRATCYRAHDGDETAEARLDQPAPAIDQLLDRHKAGSGTFITAWNPESEPRGQERNHEAGALLQEVVAARGLTALFHDGVPGDPSWAAEEGLFVLDLSVEDSIALAEQFDQNAVVRVERGLPARLVETRYMPR